jgi:hypothetical protein
VTAYLFAPADLAAFVAGLAILLIVARAYR